MKKLNFATVGIAVFLCAGSALAQNGHSGGAAMGTVAMGNGIGHSSMGSSKSSSTHSKPNTTGASQKPTVNDMLSKNPAIADKIVALTGDTAGAADACTGFKNLG